MHVVRNSSSQFMHLQMKTLVEMENSGEVALLEDDKYSDLQRMYSLFGHVAGGLDLVKEHMANHVKETGRQLVQDPERSKDPVGFVQGLLTLRDKYEEIIRQAFGDDKNFRNALNQVSTLGLQSFTVVEYSSRYFTSCSCE